MKVQSVNEDAQTPDAPTSQGQDTSPVAMPSPEGAPAWYIRHRRRLFGLVAVLLIIGGGLLLLGRGWQVQAPSDGSVETPITSSSSTLHAPSRENPWRTLQITQAAYTPLQPQDDDRVWREHGSEMPTGGQSSLFAQLMQSYRRADFAAAEQQLAQFLQSSPRHAEAHFYRGVSLLMLDKASLATGPLRSAIRFGRGRIRGEAMWYLALAYLKTDDFDSAIKELDNLIRTYMPRRSEAERLRREIREFLQKHP